MMKKFAVIGNPIEHSLSPQLHNWIFKKLNIQATYKKIKLETYELPNIFQELRNGEISGINVTMPHKENVIKFLDEINLRAKSIGCINCIMYSNDKLIGNPDAGTDMNFDFGELIAHAAKTRPLGAGTIIGSGTVSNRDRSRGSTCLAEIRTIETINNGKPKTPFLKFGDTIRIEVFDENNQTVFGSIEQTVTKFEANN